MSTRSKEIVERGIENPISEEDKVLGNLRQRLIGLDRRYLSLLPQELADLERRWVVIYYEEGEVVLGWGNRKVDFSYFGYRNRSEARRAVDPSNPEMLSDAFVLDRLRYRAWQQLERKLSANSDQKRVYMDKYGELMKGFEDRVGNVMVDYAEDLVRLHPELIAKFLIFILRNPEVIESPDYTVPDSFSRARVLGRFFRPIRRKGSSKRA
ncbi:MAG: hypothetical protein Q7S03_04170 [bacterium]|nr:hypothetical protein [bacterium]